MKVLGTPKSERREIDKNMALTLSITSGVNIKELEKQGIMKSEKGKDKKYVLMEPMGKNKVNALRELLREKGINASEPRPRNAVDALHMLEYHAVKSTSKKEFNRNITKLREVAPAEYEEALQLVEALCKILDSSETEALALLELSRMLGIECRLSSKDRRDLSLESFYKR
jgi:putative DNA methylase